MHLLSLISLCIESIQGNSFSVFADALSALQPSATADVFFHFVASEISGDNIFACPPKHIFSTVTPAKHHRKCGICGRVTCRVLSALLGNAVEICCQACKN